MKKKQKNTSTNPLTKLECEIIEFLWRWKVATSLTLRTYILQDKSFWFFYRTLRDLAQREYIEMISGGLKVDEKYSVWHLTSKAFEYMCREEAYGELEDKNFASTYPRHDMLVTAFHLGNWIYKMPSNIELFTEQELKCKMQSKYPHWVPATKVHRPDGYVKILSGNKNSIVAVEVEPSQKSIERYESVGDFYDHKQSIDYVLWLVSSESHLQHIISAFENRRNRRANIHHFVLLDDFKNNGWNAKIICGEKSGLSVLQFYVQYGVKTMCNNRSNSVHLDLNSIYLKNIKSPNGLNT